MTRGAIDEGDGREGVVGDGGDGLPLIGDGGDGLPLIGSGTTRESTGNRRRGRSVTDDGVVDLRDGRAGISA